MKKKGFFQYGHDCTDLNDSSYEDFLVADQEGLEYLRSKIDEVLKGEGEVTFPDDEIATDLMGIKLASRQNEGRKDGSGEGMACMLVLLLVLTCFILGLWKAWELIFR